ncbi:MAG: DUF945 domain-containing protein [Gammaproteobacteria bacterium]|nr:DUF945 domain-containing protein [Gammaproteobacteria bacterium]
MSCTKIIIKNSYDGTIGVNIMAGAFRLVCLNGMIIGKIFSELSNRHLETNDALKELNLLIEQTIEKSNLYITKNIMSLSELEVTDRGHILKTVQMFPLKAQDRMIEYLQRNKINTYWDLLNSATWVATHVLSRNIEATHKLEEQVFANILSLSNVRGNA